MFALYYDFIELIVNSQPKQQNDLREWNELAINHLYNCAKLQMSQRNFNQCIKTCDKILNHKAMKDSKNYLSQFKTTNLKFEALNELGKESNKEMARIIEEQKLMVDKEIQLLRKQKQ
uniref:Uncharacterized protein n=1 Tax=Acrobeloides nanus TaxID=290746 RepID=A0A914CZV9_9BILA